MAEPLFDKEALDASFDVVALRLPQHLCGKYVQAAKGFLTFLCFSCLLTWLHLHLPTLPSFRLILLTIVSYHSSLASIYNFLFSRSLIKQFKTVETDPSDPSMRILCFAKDLIALPDKVSELIKNDPEKDKITETKFHVVYGYDQMTAGTLDRNLDLTNSAVYSSDFSPILFKLKSES